MAKNTQQDDEKKEVITPQKQLDALLKETKEDHYNFEPDHSYSVPCSSLLMTATLGGGLSPGAHRFVGLSAGGKSSCVLDFMLHFLRPQKGRNPRRGVYIKAEGRLSEKTKVRSGVKFVTKSSEWEDGTCFIYESNIYEAVFKFKRDLIQNNPTNTEYFFVTDSADSLIKRDDAKKAEEESITVGGGSLITSVFLKKTGLAMAKRGHIDVYISQIRDQIKVDQYAIVTPKQGKASGARALEHQADIVIEFLPRFGGDLIRDGDPKKGKIIGHFCKTRIIKSDNEKNMVEVQYPIRYGQVGGKSVWTSYELVDFLQLWELIGRPSGKGSWYEFEATFRQDLIKETGLDVPEKIQGLEAIRDWIENNPKAEEYMFNRFKDLTI